MTARSFSENGQCRERTSVRLRGRPKDAVLEKKFSHGEGVLPQSRSGRAGVSACGLAEGRIPERKRRTTEFSGGGRRNGAEKEYIEKMASSSQKCAAGLRGGCSLGKSGSSSPPYLILHSVAEGLGADDSGMGMPEGYPERRAGRLISLLPGRRTSPCRSRLPTCRLRCASLLWGRECAGADGSHLRKMAGRLSWLRSGIMPLEQRCGA